MTGFGQATWSVLTELAPWLLFGALLAALLYGLVPRSLIERQLTGYRGAIKAVIFGVPLPLCSCGVIPAGLGLKRSGAGNGAAMGFLISTPQTGVDSILVSASFLGWPFALFKVAAAAVTGVLGGFWAEGTRLGDRPDDDEAAGLSADGTGVATADFSDLQLAAKLRAMLDHGVELLRSIWRWIAVGVLASAAIEVLLPQQAWLDLAALGAFGAAAAALVVSLPLYVCATASVPIAAALVANGLPLGAALVFLMAGPATNVATVGAIYRGFGRRATAIYLATVIAGSIGFALLFEWLVGGATLTGLHAHDHQVPWWAAASAWALLLLFTWFIHQEWTGWRQRRAAERRLRREASDTEAVEIPVAGMTCNRCATTVETALLAEPGVESARVDLARGRATVWGRAPKTALETAVESAGFRIS